ncbi:S1 family peptidase [Brevibacterium casei]|uniref:S1 family peptidase n=1 Tax=Brevibacterium casei TaxID=33889 RepID=UPI0028A95A7F|nr:S1 family peptidase [Brevibacterium casei]
MQKKLVQSSLALTAATALGLGSAFFASPAMADGPQKIDVQSDKQVEKALAEIDPGNVNAYGVKNGKLNLGVEKKTDEIKDLEKRFDNVDVIEGVGELKPYAANDIVGGAGYLVTSPSGGGACSTGFSGWDGAGNPIVLTSGHCAKDYNEDTGVISGPSTVDQTEQPSTAPAAGGDGFNRSGLGVIGTWGFSSYGSGDYLVGDDPNGWPQPKSTDIDFAVINVDETKYDVKNGVTDWTSASTNDLSTKLATDIKQVGSEQPGTVQKSGRTTGVTEGEVWTEYNEAFDYANIGGYWVHGFGVRSDVDDPFSQPGDSGGAVFQGDTAVGVISGGGPAESNGTTFQFGWVADLDYSLQQSGTDFRLTPPDNGGGDDANADAGADGADSDAGADGAAANADAGADGAGANADAGADGADSDAGADGAGANADAGADGADADASDDGNPEKPEAPKAENQTIKPNGQVTGTATPNTQVEVSWAPAGTGPQAAPAEGSKTVTSDAEGNFTLEGPEAEGDYAYKAQTVVDGQKSDVTSFTVTVQAADDATADAAAEGDDANADAAAEGDDSNANADAGADAKDANADAAADSKDSNADADDSKDGEAPAERAIAIEPKEIAASEFVKEDKGVKITVKGFDEGEKVTLEVMAGPENVKGIELTETANADGVAMFSIYGTSASNPSVYVGKYDVSVTGANDTDDESPLTGSFKVVADDQGNGGGGSDDGKDGGNGGGGSDLPRTGAELTGLAAGAGLLLVGGAAVVLTMRRVKKN